MNRIFWSLSLLLVFVLMPSLGLSAPRTFQPAVSVLGQRDFTNDLGPDPSEQGYDNPEGIAVDPTTGKLFVADTDNNRILRYSSAGAYRTNTSAELVFGQADFFSVLENRGATRNANTLSEPLGIAVDNTGTLWVADAGNNRVLRFDNASAGTVNGPDADAVLGQQNFLLSNEPDDPNWSNMDDPQCVTVNAAGQVWVSDSGNYRILRFNGAKTKANGAEADGVLGQNDLMTFDSGLLINRFSDLYGISVDRNDRLWVVDSSSNRVLRFDNASTKPNGANADGVLGQTDFISSGSPSPPEAGSFEDPSYVTAAPDGTVWVSDYRNDRVLGFRNAAAKANGAPANVVLGNSVFTDGSGISTSSRSLDRPNQIAIGREGSLFIVDRGDDRVLRYSDPVVVKAPRKADAKKGKSNIKGTSSGATRVEYKIPGQGGYRKAKGRAARWKVKARKLTRRKTIMRVRAIAFDGRRSRVDKTKIQNR